MTSITVRITFTEPLLASSPASADVYEEFIASRRRVDAEERGDEVATLPAETIERIGSSVFHRDKKGLFLFDYHLRGFLKEAAGAITGKTGITAYKSKIDKWLFVSPRRLYLENGSGTLQQPHGTESRPVRCMTAQGPRVTLKRSERLDCGTHFDARISVLPLGEKEITEDRISDWLGYGALCGLGEWRTGSYGRFSFEVQG